MTSLRDELLALDREGLEQEASRLGISGTESLSRAELIVLIEKTSARRELGDIQSFWEYRVLISGLIVVTIGTIVWVIDTYLLLTDLHVVFFDVASSLIPSLIYLVSRVIGGFLIAAALFSLGSKKRDERITPVVRASLIVVSVLIIIIVIISVSFPVNWPMI